jgi:FAD:protein FMN transferase
MSTSCKETQIRPDAGYLLQRCEFGFLGQFRAMASPCELLIEAEDDFSRDFASDSGVNNACDRAESLELAREMMTLAQAEAHRIEQKYSRFIEGNCLWQINHGNGEPIAIDEETQRLLQFAGQCFHLSEGRFDISAGPLIALWRFGPGSIPPTRAQLMAASACVGFSRVQLTPTHLQLPPGMSLDLGGIVKEYAVDRVAQLLAQRWPGVSVLVNFGGDIACPVPRDTRRAPWQVGIEDPNALESAAALLALRQGALATSGDTRRFLEHDGKRYGHIIDPVTGYPVAGAPRSVTVLAQNCIMAGMLATLAMLHGNEAEAFLAGQGQEFKVLR